MTPPVASNDPKLKMTWTIGSALKWTEAYFKKQGLLKPRLDAEILLSHAIHKRRIDLYLQFDHPLNETELSAFKELVRRRVQHEPIQYITGHQEFWSLDFSVGPGVLVPRPETECLVEQSLKTLANDTKEKIRILDIGCGSGTVAIVLAKERPGAEIVAVDISQAALACALENAKKHGVGERIEFRRSDVYEGLRQGETFDLIVSNPPYIRTDEWEMLDREIREYEPKEALVGGEEGIDFHMKIIKGASLFFQKRGALLLEIAPQQVKPLSDYREKTKVFSTLNVIKDYSHRDRVMVFKL